MKVENVIHVMNIIFLENLSRDNQEKNSYDLNTYDLSVVY